MDDNSSQTSVTDLPNKEAAPRNVQGDKNTDLQYRSTTSQPHSQMSSDSSQKASSCVCRFNGPLGDHLRSSMDCVQQLRGDQLLQMRANEEIFIIKATLILKGCPARGCPGGDHEQIPTQCLQWWRRVGWNLMRWKGSGQSADSQVIRQKVKKFRWNFTSRRGTQTSQNSTQNVLQNQKYNSQHSDNSTSQTCEGINNNSCPNCNSEGHLIQHLHQSKACLAVLIRLHLPNRDHIYRGNTRLAVFDLGIICHLCPNPGCKGNLKDEGLTKHLEGACLQFYVAEGAYLFQNWARNLTAASIRDKIKKRKNGLKAFVANEQSAGPFHEELKSILKFTCSKCSIQGPLMDIEAHNIWGTGINDDGARWECSQCRKSDDNHEMMVVHGVERVKELGYCAEPGDTLRKIVLTDTSNEMQRVVLIPGFLLQDDDEVQVDDRHLNPNGTTILVPKKAEALNHVGDDAAEKANQAKKSLEAVAEYFGRRHLYAPIAETMSVFFRLKVAEIRVERLTMLGNLSKTSKGKITGRDPNFADVKDRKPHYAQTQKYCLTNTCSWSSGARERRARESEARANVNGQIKLKIEATVLKKLAVDNPLLKEIINSGIVSSSRGLLSLISLAPTVLNFLKAKLRLLVKRIFAQNYSNWDLELQFAEREWTVKMVGYLYCQEFDELNRKIAFGEIASNDFAREMRGRKSVLPTTALHAERIVEDYGVSHERAQVQIQESCTLSL